MGSQDESRDGYELLIERLSDLADTLERLRTEPQTPKVCEAIRLLEELQWRSFLTLASVAS
jgi:hypothetical protein